MTEPGVKAVITTESSSHSMTEPGVTDNTRTQDINKEVLTQQVICDDCTGSVPLVKEKKRAPSLEEGARSSKNKRRETGSGEPRSGAERDVEAPSRCESTIGPAPLVSMDAGSDKEDGVNSVFGSIGDVEATRIDNEEEACGSDATDNIKVDVGREREAISVWSSRSNTTRDIEEGSGAGGSPVDKNHPTAPADKRVMANEELCTDGVNSQGVVSTEAVIGPSWLIMNKVGGCVEGRDFRSAAMKVHKVIGAGEVFDPSWIMFEEEAFVSAWIITDKHWRANVVGNIVAIVKEENMRTIMMKDQGMLKTDFEMTRHESIKKDVFIVDEAEGAQPDFIVDPEEGTGANLVETTTINTNRETSKSLSSNARSVLDIDLVRTSTVIVPNNTTRMRGAKKWRSASKNVQVRV